METKKILASLLATLVEAWGYDRVLKELEQHSGLSTSASSKPTKSLTAKSTPSPTQMAENAPAPVHRRALLLAIAKGYERKAIMPSTADVRDFLRLQGMETSAPKNRTEAFRHLLGVLLRLPDERLQSLAAKAEYAGGSELAAISDAISAAGQRLRGTGASDEEPNS